MGIGTSSSSGGGAHAPQRIAYAVHPDARLSWGGLPAPAATFSSARPDACHLIEESVPGVTVWIVASRGPGRRWLSYPLPAGHGLASERRACLPGPCRGVAPKRCDA